MKVECVVLNGFAEKSGFCCQILVASAICLSSSSEKPSHLSLRNFNPLSKRRRNGAGPALRQLGDAARGGPTPSFWAQKSSFQRVVSVCVSECGD